MASLVLSGDTSGSITVSAPAVAGSTTQTLVNVTGTLAPLVLDTAKSATSTSVDFTGIPSWVKRITVMFQGVSTSSTSSVQIQIGSGSFTTTGYTSSSVVFTGVALAAAASTSTTGFQLENPNAGITAATVRSGICQISNITGNAWTQSCNMSLSGSTILFSSSAGSVSLSGTLDRIRITANGTDTFDAGTINILFE